MWLQSPRDPFSTLCCLLHTVLRAPGTPYGNYAEASGNVIFLDCSLFACLGTDIKGVVDGWGQKEDMVSGNDSREVLF